MGKKKKKKFRSFFFFWGGAVIRAPSSVCLQHASESVITKARQLCPPDRKPACKSILLGSSSDMPSENVPLKAGEGSDRRPEPPRLTAGGFPSDMNSLQSCIIKRRGCIFWTTGLAAVANSGRAPRKTRKFKIPAAQDLNSARGAAEEGSNEGHRSRIFTADAAKPSRKLDWNSSANRRENRRGEPLTAPNGGGRQSNTSVRASSVR